MDLNRATILGRMTQDPEVRTTTTGKSVTSFSVATNSVWTDKNTNEKKEQAEFHNIVAWGRLGEIVAQYLKKGRQIYVEGRIQTRSWQAQDGGKKYRTEIIADNVIMLDGRGGTPAAAGPAPAANEVRYEPASSADKPAAPQFRQPDSPAETPSAPGGQAEEISVEDIPF